MRIIHFISSDKISGLEILSMNILRSLSKEHEVYYSCPDGEGIRFADELGLGTIVCDTRSVNDIKRVCSEYKPDVVHAHDPAVSFTCALAGIKYISHLHNNCLWLKKICANSIALLAVCKKATKIICVSHSIVDEYVFKKSLIKKATVISNYVDKEVVIKNASVPLDESYDISFVGRFTDQKQPFLFVDLIEKIKNTKNDIKAVMVGEGEMYDDIKKCISEKGLEDNIILAGFDKNPHKYVNASKVGVLTSKYEGFGLVAVEAMSLGKPFIAFPVGGLVNIVNDSNGKLCSDTDEMSDEIVMLLGDAEYYNSKSRGAKESAEKYTNREAYIGKILEIYKSL